MDVCLRLLELDYIDNGILSLFDFLSVSFKPISSVLRKLYRGFHYGVSFIWDARLNSLSSVREYGREIFKIYDYGRVTRMRAASFETKEPETIDWIRTFKAEESLLDIGANIGIYSLYAALKGINVIALEPDALNYALLNLNIRVNNFGKKIVAYSIAMHDVTKFSKFNLMHGEVL